MTEPKATPSKTQDEYPYPHTVAESAAYAAKALAEAEVAKVTARKLAAEARTQEYLAKEKKIHLLQEEEERQREEASNEFHRVYLFNKEVDDSSTNACMNRLALWSRIDPGCDIEIVFSSPGGYVISGMALFDYIRQMRDQGHYITTSCLGYAASMAGILLQAGNERIMGREAYILVHEVSSIAWGKFGEIEDEMIFMRMMQSRILDIFAERTKLSKKQIENKWKRKDWWLDSDEALKFGFVDSIR
jgi:Vilmaviridae head maturation protease